MSHAMWVWGSGFARAFDHATSKGGVSCEHCQRSDTGLGLGMHACCAVLVCSSYVLFCVLSCFVSFMPLLQFYKLSSIGLCPNTIGQVSRWLVNSKQLPAC
jgi:hypothetical protein